MRAYHLDYMKALAESIYFEKDKVDIYPFKDRFIEIQPSENEIIEMFPCCVLSHNRTQNVMEKDTINRARLEPIERDGEKILRTLVRLFRQEYDYSLEFWISSPEFDLLSESEAPGILDQACVYIARNRKIVLAGGLRVDVDSPESRVETGSVKTKNVYRFSLRIIFTDGIYELQEETGTGSEKARLKIIPPVLIETQ